MMNRINLLLLIFYTTLIFNAKAQGNQNHYLLKKDSNGLGFADHNGNLSAWWELGRMKFSNDFILPLRINFHSKQPNSTESVGWNWWFPIADSVILKNNETHLTIRMIGGSTMDLFSSVKNGNLYRTIDRKWEGFYNDQDLFRLTDKKGDIQLSYKLGKLKSLKISNDFYKWQYSPKGKLVSIVDNDLKKIVTLKYTNKGLLKKVTFIDSTNKKSAIKFLVAERVNVGLPVKVPVLYAINSPYNKVKSFRYKFLEKTGSYMMKSVYLTNTGQGFDLFSWKKELGEIISANGDKYKIIRGKVRPTLRIMSGGKVSQSYHYNQKLGLSSQLKDGIIHQRQYELLKGPNNGVVKWYRRTRMSDKKVMEYIQYFRDSEGLLIRKIKNEKSTFYFYAERKGDIKKFKTYLKKNNLDSTCLLLDGKGRLISHSAIKLKRK